MKVKMEKSPLPMTIVEDFGPGRGGVVVMPLSVATNGIIQEHTASGAKGTIDLTVEMLLEAVRNFGSQPGPVSIYFGHIPYSDRRETPAAGHVRDIWVEGDVLWGKIHLGPKAWKAIVEEQGFNGFSVEMDRDVKAATGTIEGWSLTGGAITNTAALDVFYVLAVESAEGRINSLRLSTPAWRRSEKKEKSMPEITLETLQAENARLGDELRKTNEMVASIQTSAKEAKEANERLALENKRLGEELDVEKARRIIQAAIHDGADPAFFQDWEKDTGKFIQDRFAGSVVALEANVSRLPRKKSTSEVGSGAQGAASGAPTTASPVNAFVSAAVALAKERNITVSAAYEAIRLEKPDLWKSAQEPAAK